jgi:hypothetical protein
LPDEVEFELKGQLKQLSYINVSRLKSRVRSFGGRRNVPVIVYSIEEGECPEIKWLIAYGMVTEDSNEHAYSGTETGGSLITQNIELTIALHEPFKQLSQWFWELRPLDQRLLDPFSGEAAQSGLNGFWQPLYFDEIPENHYFVRWQETETYYNPTFWGLNHLYQMTHGGTSSDFVAAPLELFVYANEDLWAIEPQSIYAFTGLSALGEITIETELKTGLFHNETLSTVSRLNLVQLDEDLVSVGYGGLNLDDIIFTGASKPRPGFIQRSGETLAGVRPRWDYQGAYPGEISKGASWITVTPYLTDAQVAYNIDYRTS